MDVKIFNFYYYICLSKKTYKLIYYEYKDN